MKHIAWLFAVLLATAGLAGARADDRKTDAAASQSALCKPLPRQRRLINLEFKPASRLVDVAGAYAAMSCKKLHITGDQSSHKVTLGKHRRLSLAELSAMVRAQAEKAGLRWAEDDTSITLGPVAP
jgi:hypothetical protein